MVLANIDIQESGGKHWKCTKLNCVLYFNRMINIGFDEQLVVVASQSQQNAYLQIK